MVGDELKRMLERGVAMDTSASIATLEKSVNICPYMKMNNCDLPNRSKATQEFICEGNYWDCRVYKEKQGLNLRK